MTIAGIIKSVAYKAGIRRFSERYNFRYNVKIAMDLGTFFSTILSNIKTVNTVIGTDVIR